MGVPKFFRYISERYPCLSEVIKEYQIPEFDHLYLDMNGIIHMCSHPDDGDAHFRITEVNIFQDIFHYIEVLFRMIKPQKLFFMAIDGVAPRAKMNQQRGRRFRSAKEAVSLEEKALERGEELPKEARFDSNCITPGTVFMARLQEQLKYFVVNKVSTDKTWQKCKIILSGHETPGEGEHKIMDYIRFMRAQPGYDPNTRHCLYGLDADLIMLGLCTHEPHFSLLREEVRFGKKSTKRKSIPEQITFFLLHLSLMREYLELEFISVKDSLPFKYDMEKIIDDWVLMGFLVGNDFIPNLPNMHITTGALPTLYETYMKVLPTLGGYINEAGTLKLDRFEKFIEALSKIDMENFSDTNADLKWFEAKTGRKLNGSERSNGNLQNIGHWDDCMVPGKARNADLAALIKDTDSMFLDEPDSGDEIVDSDSSKGKDDLVHAEFLQHKTDYYMNKLEYQSVTPEVLRSQAEGYVRAIQWNLNYYYNGVCSWSWYYPHHYAPYVSDIKGFSNLKLEFDLGTPFMPYEQLLAVLPAASKSLLPEAYQGLMTEENSPIKAYYPEDFKTDLNGKRQEWEAVVLIPFIEEDRLLKAMATCANRLTDEERNRNRHGPMLSYKFVDIDLGEYIAPEYFPPVRFNHAHCKRIFIDEIVVPREKLIKGAYPGAKMDVYYPGFPTMKHLKYTGSLAKAKIRVFEQPSRGESMILNVEHEKLADDDLSAASVIANELLSKIVHVGWPHLVEAKVVAVSDKLCRYHSTGESGQYNVEENKDRLLSQWYSEKLGITDHYMSRLGVNVGDTDILVHVKVMSGRKYDFSKQGRVTLEKQWSIAPSVYPYQIIVQNISVHSEVYTSYKDVESVFPLKSQCFMLGNPYYGAVGEVIDSTETLKRGRIKVAMKVWEEPDLTSIMLLEQDIKVRYMQSHGAATGLAISKNLFSRITGAILVTPGSEQLVNLEDAPKINVGLNLKFNKKNEEIPGYTRKDGNVWLYSEKAVKLVQSYLQLCPKLFTYLNCNVGNDIFYEEDIFPDGDGKEQIKEVTSWIKKQSYYSLERQVCGSEVLDPEVVKKLEEVIDEFNKKTNSRQVIMQVPPRFLYKPELQMGNLMPDPTATFELYDRVINVREGHTVPVGLKGTIIAVHKPSTSKEDETTYDVLFDQPFAGGLEFNCSPNRGYRMPRPAVINISHGLRVMEKKTGKPGQLRQNLQAAQNRSAHNHTNNAHNQLNSQPAYPEGQGFVPFNANYKPPSFAAPKYDYKNHQTYNFNPNSFFTPNSNAFMTPPFVAPFQNLASGFGPNYQTGQPQFVPAASHGGNVGNSVVKSPPKTSPQKKPAIQGSPIKQNKLQVNQEDIKKQPPREVREVPNANDNKPKTYKVNTDALRRMLNINESSNRNIGVKKQEKAVQPEDTESVSITVQKFFAQAKARSTSESKGTGKDSSSKVQSKYSTVELMSYYQAQNLGYPRYHYFELPDNNFQAQLILSDGIIIDGLPAQTKEEASENAASKALAVIRGGAVGKVRDVRPLVPATSIPFPPNQWRQPATQPQTSERPFSSQSAGRDIQRGTNKSYHDQPGSQRKQQVGSLRKGATDFLPSFNRGNGNAQDNWRSHENWRGVEAKQDMTATNPAQNVSSFIPLQAVKKQRSRVVSQSSDDNNVVKENVGVKTDAKYEKGTVGDKVSATQENVEVSAASNKIQVKPKRKKEMRIAAVFPSKTN